VPPPGQVAKGSICPADAPPMDGVSKPQNGKSAVPVRCYAEVPSIKSTVRARAVGVLISGDDSPFDPKPDPAGGNALRGSPSRHLARALGRETAAGHSIVSSRRRACVGIWVGARAGSLGDGEGQHSWTACRLRPDRLQLEPARAFAVPVRAMAAQGGARVGAGRIKICGFGNSAIRVRRLREFCRARQLLCGS